ncbi:MAG: hypothetical protein WEA09_02845 [Gemmatimonadota bacterium]
MDLPANPIHNGKLFRLIPVLNLLDMSELGTSVLSTDLKLQDGFPPHRYLRLKQPRLGRVIWAGA